MADKVLVMEQLSDIERLKVLEARGGLAWWSGDMIGASAFYGDALELARARGSSHDIVNALYNAGLAMDFAEPGSGKPHLAEGLAISESEGDVRGLALIRWGISNGYEIEQDYDNAHEQLLLAYEGFEAVGDVFMLHWTHRVLGVTELELGLLEEARSHLKSALDFFAASGDLSGTILLLRDHARLAVFEGDVDHALQLVGAAQAQEAENGLAVSHFELAAFGAEDMMAAIDEVEAEVQLAIGRTLSIDEAVTLAESPA